MDEITAGTAGYYIIAITGKDFHANAGARKDHQWLAGGTEHGVVVLRYGISPCETQVVDDLEGIWPRLSVDDYISTKIDRA